MVEGGEQFSIFHSEPLTTIPPHEPTTFYLVAACF
jgi:hypothetical protein